MGAEDEGALPPAPDTPAPEAVYENEDEEAEDFISQLIQEGELGGEGDVPETLEESEMEENQPVNPLIEQGSFEQPETEDADIESLLEELAIQETLGEETPIEEPEMPIEEPEISEGFQQYEIPEHLQDLDEESILEYLKQERPEEYEEVIKYLSGAEEEPIAPEDLEDGDELPVSEEEELNAILNDSDLTEEQLREKIDSGEIDIEDLDEIFAFNEEEEDLEESNLEKPKNTEKMVIGEDGYEKNLEGFSDYRHMDETNTTLDSEEDEKMRDEEMEDISEELSDEEMKEFLKVVNEEV